MSFEKGIKRGGLWNDVLLLDEIIKSLVSIKQVIQKENLK